MMPTYFDRSRWREPDCSSSARVFLSVRRPIPHSLGRHAVERLRYVVACESLIIRTESPSLRSAQLHTSSQHFALHIMI